MSEPFLAEIRIVAFTFPPRGWAFCDGQILPINQSQSLYSLLGTTDVGISETSFALPDLRGRVPMHVGTRNQGARGGEESHVLTAAEMPNHTHTLHATIDDATGDDPTGFPNGPVAARAVSQVYGAMSAPGAMGSESVAHAGGGQAHENMMPSLALNFIIALVGTFPGDVAE